MLSHSRQGNQEEVMKNRQRAIQDWLERVRRNEPHIYVREGGRTEALSDLPPDRWAYHVAFWLSEGRTPVIYRGP